MDEPTSFWGYIKEFQVIISSTLAILSAFYIVSGNRKTAAMTNATSVIREISQDKVLQDGLKIVRDWNKNGNKASISCLATPSESDDEEHKAKRTAIFHVLNQYEKIAVGVHNGIYSEKVIKESSAGTIVHMINVVQPLIDACRNDSNRHTIWQEIECLAKKWKDKPLKTRKIKNR